MFYNPVFCTPALVSYAGYSKHLISFYSILPTFLIPLHSPSKRSFTLNLSVAGTSIISTNFLIQIVFILVIFFSISKIFFLPNAFISLLVCVVCLYGRFWRFLVRLDLFPDIDVYFYSPFGTEWLIAPRYLLMGDGFAKFNASTYKPIQIVVLFLCFQ